MVRSTGVPSAVFSRYFASQIWREIGAIRSETDPIIASTFISMASPYFSLPALLQRFSDRGKDVAAMATAERAACSYADRDARAIGVTP